MKAITIGPSSDISDVSNLHLTILPIPTPLPNQVLIRIKAFGLNHAELHMRQGTWAEAAPVSGIECVGLVESDPSGTFTPGTKVVALMGGLGRSINGSYAEYTVAPVTNVVEIKTGLSWEELAAIPETFATAWTALFRNLEVQERQTLLVRGATSSLGRAAVKLAVQAGAKVLATTRREGRFQELQSLGVTQCFLENPSLAQVLQESVGKVDAILNLVGNSVLIESLTMVKRGGKLCLAGFLGGLAPIKEFDPLAQMASGVHFSFFASPVFGNEGFPVSDVPLQGIVDDVEARRLTSGLAGVFAFGEDGIREAHGVMEKAEAGGKLVVVV